MDDLASSTKLISRRDSLSCCFLSWSLCQSPTLCHCLFVTNSPDVPDFTRPTHFFIQKKSPNSTPGRLHMPLHEEENSQVFRV